ncbi:unnamed protein product [Closterium sp. NIES-54]
MLEAAMAWSNDDLSAFEVNVKHCLQIRNQPDNELTHLLEQALHKLRGQEIQVLVLRETLRAILATNSELATRMKGFELMEARLREHVQLVTQQRNGLRQQLRNTQEHRRRLSQQIMEAQDISLQVLRDCVREIDRVPAQGVQQLVRAINYHIQPVLEEEGEDIIEVTPEPKIFGQTACAIARLDRELSHGIGGSPCLRICDSILVNSQPPSVQHIGGYESEAEGGADRAQGGENRAQGGEDRTNREERTGQRRRGQDTGRREQNTGRREQDTGRREQDTGRREQDSGRREQDTGRGEEDTGRGEEDTGRGEQDTGKREQDTERGEQDTGRGEQDTGRREQDTGRREQDTGRREQDTGRREQDTGRREQDTGRRELGTGHLALRREGSPKGEKQ